MAESRKSFTFIWKIKNFSFSSLEIFSPSFFVHEMSETKWKFILNPNSSRHRGCVACYLQRDVNDNGPEQFELDHELSFLGDGFVLQSEIFLKKIYRRGNWLEALHVKKGEIFLLKKELFIPDDILTIRCRMWDNRESITRSEWCFAETCIETECRVFIGIIKKFSSIAPGCKDLVCSQSSSTETFLSSMNLCVANDSKLAIEIKLVNQKSLSKCRCRIFIRDIFGNKVKSGQSEFHDNESHSIPLTFLKEHLMENKRDYLLNDMLTIECEITFPSGKTTEKIDEPQFGFDFQDISSAMKTNLFSKEYHTQSFTTLMDDLSSLQREGVLCDTKLKTATETFPAHMAVLSARSPVFKSMFTAEMKEKTHKCVDIDDLDADTIRQMLLFMYTDTLKDMNHESAKSLYFAADKYNIVPLRFRCSSFLKKNLLASNYVEILLLADKHQDNDLKSAVQDYIIKNDKVILISDEWKNLEQNNPSLEVLRSIYIKARRI